MFAFAFASNLAAQPDAAKWSELNSEGIRLAGAGRIPEAEAKFRAAFFEADVLGETDYRFWANLSNLALMRQEQGDFAAAEKLYRRVLELREKFLPPESSQIASALNNLGAVLHEEGRDLEADPLLRRGLLLAENAHDDKTMGALLNTLGIVLYTMGEDARAEPVLRRSIALFEKAEGPDSLDAGKARNNLATVYMRQSEFLKAEEQQRWALPIYEKYLPAGHLWIAVARSNLFAILAAQNRAEEGEPYLRSALQIANQTAPGDVHTQQILTNFATLKASRGDWRAAADLYKQVIGVEERALGPNHPSLATVLAHYSEALKHLHQKAEAKQAERRASAILKSFHE